MYELINYYPGLEREITEEKFTRLPSHHKGLYRRKPSATIHQEDREQTKETNPFDPYGWNQSRFPDPDFSDPGGPYGLPAIDREWFNTDEQETKYNNPNE
jgi:hypothetical protein